MQVLYERCCGLDVHKNTVVGCILLTQSNGQVQKCVQTFAATTSGLLALADWLTSLQVTHIALESTGIFWRPVFNVVEEGHTIILVNAQHMKAVPGRKTDVKDSEWLADLLRHGLLKASFIPTKPTRDLRDLVRYRKTLVYERTQEINRLHKVLETANIKLSSVVTDVLGKSGRSMLSALIDGVSDAEALADLARGSLRKKLPQLQEALQGRVEAHHRVLLQHLFAHIAFLENTIEHLQLDIEQRLSPFEEAMQLLLSIPGIQEITAAAILGEIGCDMSRFPSAKHLASWAGVCPGNKQSGGKRLSGKPTKGNPRLRAALAEGVWSISHKKDNYLSAQYHRFARRLGKPKAVMAVAHSVLVIIYHVLSDKQPYRDLGTEYFDSLDKERLARQSVRRLEALGFAVTVTTQEVRA
ncbi:MAG: IS110 family transposase [Ktedonobacteraceae bacterium]